MTISPPPSRPPARRRATRARLTALTLVAGLLAATSASRAQVPELELRWQAPAPCPSEAAVRDEIRALLGREPRPSAPEGVRVLGRVYAEEGRYRLRLRSRRGRRTDERELRAPRCDELVRAAALIVALAIDPEATGRASSPAPPEAPSERKEEPDADDEPRKRDREGRLREGYVTFGGQFDSGSLPRATGGMALGLGLRAGRFEGELSALWFPNREGLDVTAQIAAAALRMCVRLGGERVSGSLCADGEMGGLIARGGSDLATSERGRGPWSALGPGARLRARIRPHFGLSLGAAILGILTRPTIVATLPEDSSERLPLFRPNAWTARAELRGEVWF